MRKILGQDLSGPSSSTANHRIAIPAVLRANRGSRHNASAVTVTSKNWIDRAPQSNHDRPAFGHGKLVPSHAQCPCALCNASQYQPTSTIGLRILTRKGSRCSTNLPRSVNMRRLLLLRHLGAPTRWRRHPCKEQCATRPTGVRPSIPFLQQAHITIPYGVIPWPGVWSAPCEGGFQPSPML